MPDPDATQPTPKPLGPISPGPTPTGYQRTGGGGFKWQPPSPEKLAQLLPQYDIEALIGRGGMGAVYKGTQKALERPVAIKILPPEVDDEDASYTERFKNEAKIMARLEHPAIVPVYDFGETSEGQLYFVMGFINGTDIHQMIQSQGKLPPEHALAITAHVCDALGYAHAHGVIHRDIKPSNILINMEGQVKVADFGLAKAHDTSQSSGLTKTGLAMGTPDYVAPETLSIGMVPDGRADLYAVGVMLYQMLTGQVPRGAFDLPSKLTGCDPRFDSVVIKAMKYDREDRYPTATDLRRDLDIILTAPMVQSGGQSSAAIPKQSLPQKPTGKRPQPRSDAGPPARKESPPAAKSARTTPEPPAKSKTSLFIGLGAAAAIGIGAFAMFGGKKEAKPSAPLAPSSGTSVATVPKTVPAPPKPVPAAPGAPVAKSSSSSTASQSSDQFPPGKWVKVFSKFEDIPVFHRKDGTLAWKDGWLDGQQAANTPLISIPDVTARNIGLRLKVKLQEANAADFIASLSLRRAEAADGKKLRYTLVLGRNPKELRLNRSTESGGGSMQQEMLWRSAEIADLKEGVEHAMEFSVIGSRLFVRWDGGAAQQVSDDKLVGGGLAIQNRHLIRDLEVINLDGLSEAEALKILGVDEKGNDLRQQPATVASATPAAKSATAPASSSPSLPVSKSPPAFPAGQWVNTTSSVLRDNVKRVQSVDGWLVAAKTGLSLRLNGPDAKNQGVRCILRAQGGRISTIGLESKGISNKIEVINNEVALTQHAHSLGRGSEQLTKLKLTPLVDGAVHVIELYRLGDRLIGRFDKLLLTASLESSVALMDCFPAAMNVGNNDISIRDIEVINLDGLPEAEALRILGVDEKGNDLRAVAAKQEQQKAEQAKQADAIAVIPELKALHDQFTKLTAERVTAPFEKDLAALNTSYLGGLERKMAELKQKGDLDGVLALEAEKKLIADKQPMPAEDNDATPATLKDLRKIYREAHAKLEATRALNLKALTDPLAIRLKQLESTLTQANRIDHAKTVREYREGLGKEGSAGTPARTSPTGGAAAKMNEAGKSARAPLKKFPPSDDRKAAEWVLSVGGTIRIQGSDKMILDATDLPRGRFEVTGVYLEFTSTNRPKGPIENLLPLAGLKGLTRLNVKNVPMTEAHWEILPSLPSLQAFMAERTGVTDGVFAHLAATQIKILDLNYETSITGEGIEGLSAQKSLEKLSMYNFLPSEEGMRQLGKLETLRFLALSGSGSKLRDEHLPLLAGLKKLDSLLVRRSALTAEALAAMKQWSTLTTLGFDMKPGTTAAQVALLAKAFPKLETLSLEGEASWSYAAEDVSALTGFPKLKAISMTNSAISDEALAGVLALPKLESLRFSSCTKVTDAALENLGRHKSLTALSLEAMPNITDAGLPHLIGLKSLSRLELLRCPNLTSDAIAAFQKARPDVTVTR